MIGLPIVVPGKPQPLGATYDGSGVNFAVFSKYATKVTLCLFTDQGQRERHRLDLIRDGTVWSGYVDGIMPGQPYGYRIDGPYDPPNGHRFNVNKLLIDPYARQISGPLTSCNLAISLAHERTFPVTTSATASPSCPALWSSPRKRPRLAPSAPLVPACKRAFRSLSPASPT